MSGLSKSSAKPGISIGPRIWTNLEMQAAECLQTKARHMTISAPGPDKTHKHKGICSVNGVRRFTGGSMPQGPRPGLIYEGFGPVCSTIRDPRKIP